MNLTVKDIDVIIEALLNYLEKILDLDENWSDIAMTLIGLIKDFKNLRKEKVKHE